MGKKQNFFFECRWYVYIFLFVFICNSIPAILGNAAASHKKKRKKVLLRFLSPEKAASHYWLNRDGSVGI